LRGKGLEQLDCVGLKLARRLAAHDQRADHLAGAQQRYQQPRPVAGAQDHVVHQRRRQLAQIGGLARLTRLDSPTAAEISACILRTAAIMSSLMPNVALSWNSRLGLIEDVDRARLGAGNLRRLGNDSVEHSLQVERRIDGLGHFAERAQFPTDRVSSDVRARNSFTSRTFSIAITA
jgi:hypothetical protein